MTSRIIISFFLLNLLLAFSGQAQVTRSFEDRVSYNVNGNITMIGNTLLTCDSDSFWCPYIQSGQVSSSNGREMVFVNVDSAAGYDNSSTANLTIPNGASVLHAELYWSGRHNNNEANRDKIRIKAPGSGSYTQVTAHTIDTYSSEGESGSRPYQASADITQIVVNGGTGSYTVGDLKAKTGNDGLGFYGGWAIAVVYQDNTEPFRRLMLFDGAAKITGTNTVSITTDNLVTPYSGSFNTYLGALVWEGDQSLDDDAFVFEGNTLSDSLNPANNYWNSSITAFNSRVNTKNPDYVNQLAMDLVMTDVSGLLANGETQADIDFVTDGDSYFPHALAFVTDLYLPDFSSTMDKTATDLNGGQVEPGDVIEYRVSFENTGQDVAINTVVTDALPTGISYVPNSLEIVNASAGPAGAMSDAIGDDAAEYDANSNTITFWVGNNANANQGGDFLPGETAVVKFLATVDNQNSGTVSNSATIDFNPQTTPDESLTAEDDAVINVVASASINVTKTAQLTIDNGNPGTADAGDEITFSIDVENTGNLAMNNIHLTDAMAPLGAVTCPSNSLAAFSLMSCDSYTYTVTQTDISNGGSIDNTVQLTADDAAGGNHQDSASTQTVLTLAEPVITAPSEGDLLNDSTPTVSGTGPVGAQIDVLTNQGNSCQTVVDGSGNWSCDIAPALNDGVVIISAFASDGGSNQSATDSVTVNLDATAPGAPEVDAPTNGQPITGTGEPGATVTVVTDNGDSCTAVVNNNGNWSCDLGPGVVDGDNITVTQEDEAGNVSPPTIIPGGIDIQAPTVTITAPTNGDLTNDNTPTVSGTSEVGAEISVTIGGVEVCSTIADGSGNWSCEVSPAVADGSVQIDVTASDAAGNTSNPESVSIDVDTTAPDAPLINTPTNGQDVTGTNGEPGATVHVTTPGGASCTAIVQGDGSWSCTLTGNLVNGDDITATQTDEAGNESAPTTVSGGLDTEAPSVTITAPVNGDLTNDNTPTVSGTSEVGAEISVTIGGVEVCSTIADGSGNWSCEVSPAVADGSVQIDVTASDAAGNSSNPESVSIDVDTTAPDAPVINAPTNGQPVTGTGEPDATVTVTTPGGASCTAIVQGDGSWSCTLTGNLVNGDDITATQTDEAGNESDPTTVNGGLDTEAPGIPTITSPQNGTTINNALPVIGGMAEANSTVTVSNQSGVICVAQTNASGEWSCTPGSPLADGLQQLQAVAEDTAGNESQPGSTSFTVNSGASHTLIIDGATDLTTTEAGGTDSFTISLPLTPSADVTVNLSSSDTTEGTVSPSSVTFTTANWNQAVTVTVTGVDDQIYDQDQAYTIDFSPLSSADNNYNGVQVSSADAINEDDDARPDLSVFLTNCIDGSLPQQPISYYLTVTNTGNTDIQGARLTTVMPDNMSVAEWDCVDQAGLPCGRATGQGDLDELVDLDSQESMLFTFVADVDGELNDFLDATGQIEMPSGTVDVNPTDNQAEDHDLLYQFLFKDGFECAAPGTIEETNLQLEQLLNLR